MRVHLRYTHPNGSSKDWIAEATATELRVQHGKTGKRMQLRVTPASKCKGGSPVQQLQKKMNEKIGNGYMDITPTTPQPPSPEPPKPRTRKASKDLAQAMKEFNNQGQTWF